MEATLRPKRSFSLHRYRPGERVGLSLVWLAPLIAQVEFDRRDVPCKRSPLMSPTKRERMPGGRTAASSGVIAVFSDQLLN
jgi:hypothetical protein